MLQNFSGNVNLAEHVFVNVGNLTKCNLIYVNRQKPINVFLALTIKTFPQKGPFYIRTWKVVPYLVKDIFKIYLKSKLTSWTFLNGRLNMAHASKVVVKI